MRRPFPWEASYPAGIAWDAPITVTTLPAMLDRAVIRFADKPAIEHRGRTISFTRLGELSVRMAARLLAAGAGAERPVALYLPNTPWHPLAFLGAARIGAPVVHLSPLDAPRELAHKVRDSGARILVTTDATSLLANALKLLEAGDVDLVLVGRDADWGPGGLTTTAVPDDSRIAVLDAALDGIALPPSWPVLTPEAVALIQYTGGTTGTPKGAILTHANLTAALAIYDLWNIGQGLSTPGEDIVICVLPLFHIYGLTTLLLRHINNGNLILLRTRFDPEQALADIEERRATTFPGVPTMWIALVARPDLERRDLSSLRFCGSGGAPLPVEVAERFRRLTGMTMGGGWGMTETSPAGTYLPRYGSPPAGTIGLPLPHVEMGVVALDDPGRELPVGEVGELRIRGPNVTRGYWKRPEETARAFRDGYFLTGDIGRMDEAGFFFLVDRKKDMIISGGFNVYPQMIEQAIYEHADVEECLVVGVPDGYRGEAAKAFVKLKAGAPTLTLDALQAFLADKIGRHEMPTALEIRPALPRTPVGKLSKIELREEERKRAATNTSPDQ